MKKKSYLQIYYFKTWKQNGNFLLKPSSLLYNKIKSSIILVLKAREKDLSASRYSQRFLKTANTPFMNLFNSFAVIICKIDNAWHITINLLRITIGCLK